MGCIPAATCKKALADATARWPSRNRASDGICGDEAHQARPSDHNLGNAFDLTCDVPRGVDCNEIANALTASNDKRIKYVIFNRRIWYPTANGRRPKGWSDYSGDNPHIKHIHVSIKPDSRNDLSSWPWSSDGQPEARPVLRRGDRGVHVELLQCKLGIEPDGIFGFGTENAVKKFQTEHGLTADGIVGAKSWAALTAN